MEKKIQDDQLGDYVRQSFEDYEEDPSPGMWDRVEGNLQPAAPAKAHLSFRRYRWRAAAAVILLLVSGLVCEHFYYEKKIKDLTAEKSSAGEIPVEKPKESKDVNIEKNALQNAEQQVGSKHFFEKKSESATFGDQNNKTPFSGQQRVNQSLPLVWNPNSESVQKSVAHLNPSIDHQRGSQGVPHFSEYVPNSALQVPEAAADQNQTAFENPDIAPAAPIQNQVVEQGTDENLATNEAVPFVKLDGFDPLATRILYIKDKSQSLGAFAYFPIKRANELSGWYAGAYSTPHFTFDHAKAPVRRPGGRPVFVSRQEAPDVSVDWWLKLGKKLNSRFSLESGIGYSEISRTATHTPRFRFAEGTTGGNPQRRNFNYDLNTYGGSAAVSLRMEQVDNAPVQDDEPVALRIKTSERTQLLRIPLIATYRLGMGRLHGVVRAGLTGNFFLKNELDISARVSQSSRFQPIQGSGSYTVQLEKQGRFFLGYWLSAGGELRMNRHVSLVAEPSLSGDFPRNSAAGRRLPGRFSFGMNVGANYYF